MMSSSLCTCDKSIIFTYEQGHLRPCCTRQFFVQLVSQQIARQVARKISRVTPQFCNLQQQQNVAMRVARKVEIFCV